MRHFLDVYEIRLLP